MLRAFHCPAFLALVHPQGLTITHVPGGALSRVSKIENLFFFSGPDKLESVHPLCQDIIPQLAGGDSSHTGKLLEKQSLGICLVALHSPEASGSSTDWPVGWTAGQPDSRTARQPSLGGADYERLYSCTLPTQLLTQLDFKPTEKLKESYNKQTHRSPLFTCCSVYLLYCISLFSYTYTPGNTYSSLPLKPLKSCWVMMLLS